MTRYRPVDMSPRLLPVVLAEQLAPERSPMRCIGWSMFWTCGDRQQTCAPAVGDAGAGRGLRRTGVAAASDGATATQSDGSRRRLNGNDASATDDSTHHVQRQSEEVTSGQTAPKRA
jgi:hypothetical protein